MRGQKTGGRAAGTPNKISKELRDVLKAIISRELESLTATLEGLPSKERIELLIKILPFCLPKINSIGGAYDSGWDILES